jgi:hypothetical protein
MPSLIGSVIVGVLVFLAFCGVEEAACSSKAGKMGFKSDYGPVQGCMIQVEKHWIPIESYRTIGGVD